MVIDWEMVQATSVVLSIEFLFLGVIVLFVRALRRKPSEQSTPKAESSIRPVPTKPATVMTMAAATDKPRFLAMGTEPKAQRDGLGAPWDVEADWADLVDTSPPKRRTRRQPRASRPLGPASVARMPGLPPARAMELRPAADVGHPIFGKKTRVYRMSDRSVPGADLSDAFFAELGE